MNAAIGLDIGKHSVKLVELTQEGEAIKLQKLDSVPIAAQAHEAHAASAQILKRTLAGLFKKGQIKNKQVVMGVNGQSIFVKFLEILPVGTDALQKTIRYEAQQQIPFSLDEVEWDTHILPRTSQDKAAAYQVLLVAIKKERLTERKLAAEQARLHPAILDVSSLSIYNCLRFNQDVNAAKLTVVLDIGAQSTDLLILKGDDLWMRSFAIGGDNFAAHKEDARQVLEDLQGEISRSIEYYQFQQGQAANARAEIPEQPPAAAPATAPATAVDEILLSGGGAQISGLDKFLQTSFSCAVRMVEPFKKLLLDEAMQKQVANQKKTIFTQAVGLALRGLGQSQINVNLLKEQIKAKALAQQRLIYSAASVILAIAILFSASTFMRHDYRAKSVRLRKLSTMLKTFTAHQSQLKELQAATELLSRRTNLLRTLAVNRALWLESLEQLHQMFPDDLWLTDVSASLFFNDSQGSFATKFDIQGKAGSYDGVNGLVAKLKSSQMFTEVKPLSSEIIEEELQPQTEGAEGEKIELVKFAISMCVAPR